MDDNRIDTYRSEFPVCERYCYLDHAGIAPMSIRVRRSVERFLKESTEGAAFYYTAWNEEIERVRRVCAKLINAEPGEIAFIKSTSHGISLVAQGLDWKPGDSVLVYEKEFPANLYPWFNLRKKGVEVKMIPANGCRIRMEDMEKLMDERTRVVAISAVQFTNGFRMDLQRLGEICTQRNIFLCVDAIQALGVVPLDVRRCHVDFLSADAHKWLLGPEGIGIFFCRKELAERLRPALIGWKSVQNALSFEHPEYLLKMNALRFEEGSMNVMGIVGLGAAVDLLTEVGIDAVERRVLGLGSLVREEAEKRGLSVLTPPDDQERAGITTITGAFDAMKARDGLRDKGIMVNVRAGGLRISPHFYNNRQDITMMFAALDEVVSR